MTDLGSDNLQQVPVGFTPGPDSNIFVPIERNRDSNELAVRQATIEPSVTGQSSRPKCATSQRVWPLDDQFLYY